MNTHQNETFKRRLELLEQESQSDSINFSVKAKVYELNQEVETQKRSKKIYQILLLGLLSFNVVYFGSQQIVSTAFGTTEVFEGIDFSLADVDASEVSTEGNYDPKLLQGMGSMMEELGYLGLTPKHLAALRDRDLTATFVSQMHNMGFTNITLAELVKLSSRDVSSRFVAMMQTLGYTSLTVNDIIRLKDNGVTAHYTSNLHDLGYSDISIEELIRLKNVGVSIGTVKNLIKKNGGEKVSLEDILRYQISNQ